MSSSGSPSVNKIHNNIVDRDSAAYYTGIAITYDIFNDKNDTIFCSGNTLKKFNAGFWIFNYNNDLSSVFPFCSMENNIFQCTDGIYLRNPFPDWVLKNNEFNALGGVDIYLTSTATTSNNCGFRIIESNTLGYTPQNTGNVLTPIIPNYDPNDVTTHIDISGRFDQRVKVIGQTLHGQVRISGTDSKTDFRQNKMYTDYYNPNLPHDLLGTGNGSIVKPQLQKLTIFSTSIQVEYQLAGLNSSNTDFVVDFYGSDSKGSLLDYIGSQTITTLTGGTYTNIFSFPHGFPYTRVAATVTSIGTISNVGIGTSEVSYISKELCCTNQFLTITSDSLDVTTTTPVIPSVAISLCKNVPYTFSTGCVNAISPTPDYSWRLADNDTLTSDVTGTGSTFAVAGLSDTLVYILTLKRYGSACDTTTSVTTVNVISCEPPKCYDCISSFAPIPGKKYLVSAWVKENNAAATKTSYTYPQITIECPSVSFTSATFAPTGTIIDGWQKIDGEFIVPANATDLKINLNCTTGDCFFDDIRVLPFDGSMKSYVYDPVNLRLVTELDERNYATFYEYDEEGKLIRVKKETKDGTATIQESRDNSVKR